MDIQLQAATTYRDATEAERSLALGVGLPANDAWTVAAGHRGAQDISLTRDDIVASGGFAGIQDRHDNLGDSPIARVTPVSSPADLGRAIKFLRESGASEATCGEIAATLVLGINDSRYFIVVAETLRDGRGVALLAVKRVVEVGSEEEEAAPTVDYDLEALFVFSSGPMASLAEAACHAALGLQFDADLMILGKSLMKKGYDGEVLSNVICHSDRFNAPSIRLANVLETRIDLLYEAVGMEIRDGLIKKEDGAFPDFRPPAVLDF